MNARQLHRFWDKVERTDACWLWTASLYGGGYGQFVMDGTRGAKVVLPAHRAAYQHFVGPIPDGLTLDHLCRTRACVNPAHLEPVTRGENVLRGESPAAKNKRKTECKRGHPFDEGNTYWRPDRPGQRHCRACDKERKTHG